MDYSAPTRETRVISIEVIHTKAGDALHPMPPANEDPQDEVWTVWLVLQDGFLPETTSGLVFEAEEIAQKFQDEHPVGSLWIDPGQEPDPSPENVTFIRGLMDDCENDYSKLRRGDENSFIPLDALSRSGVWEGTNTAAKVKECLGEERLSFLKEQFPENWSIAAEFEYCYLNLPHSSAAYIAALQRFHYYISGDDFSAGYLLRDLEIVCAGVESTAKQTIDMRKKAGARGRESSARARSERIADLIDHMERIASRNPDIKLIGIESLASLAADKAIDENPKLWSQGKGQIEEYVSEIRRGEAGDRLQRRLYSLFSQKTA